MAVIIVGGGIGGLAFAVALSRRGIASVVLEAADEIAEVGAGIQLSPNATRIMTGWGLETGLLSAAVEPERAEVRDAASARVLLVNRLGADARSRWGAPYLTLTRAALQSLLLDEVSATGLSEVRLQARVVSAEPEHGAVVLAGGERIEGSAVVGCDGLRSTVRAGLFGDGAPRFTGQTAWRGLARMDDNEAPRVEVFTGPDRHFVRYPVAPGLVNMVAVKEAAAGEVEAWDAAGTRDELTAAFADWPAMVRDTIAAVEEPWRQALYARPPLLRWSIGRASLLGDAAHPMLPFLAQGAAMAIEDAEVLATCLAAGGAVEEALNAYEGQRRARTAKVQGWASRNARLFHLPSPAAKAAFGAAALTDRALGKAPEARLDWLYGYQA